MASPSFELARLAALARYELLESKPDPGLDGLVQLAALAVGAPAAAVTVVDADTRWFVAQHGVVPEPAPREATPCDEVVRMGRLVASDGYLGVPLEAPDGYVLGALCVLGVGSAPVEVLQLIARQVVDRLEWRRLREEQERLQAQVYEPLAYVATNLELALHDLASLPDPGPALSGAIDALVDARDGVRRVLSGGADGRRD